ncbi:unnamed protein product [Musa banksii]
MQQLWRLSDAYQLSLKVKAKLARSEAKRYSNVPLHSSSKVHSARYNGTNYKKCIQTNSYQFRISHLLTCFKCKHVEHYINECPNRQTDARVNFIEKEDANEQLDDIGEPIYDEYPKEAYEEITLEGECLVIHRVLASLRDDSNEE